MRINLSNMIEKRKREGLNPIVAEIKTYSPKYGDLLKGRNPLEILEVYEKCRVAGVSYITERKYFKGDLNTLKSICDSSHLPVLRKDFVTSKQEIEKTAEIEASAILLIAKILEDKTAEFVDFALEHGLESVVEVHDVRDVTFALETKTPMIGINNRDIAKLEKDEGTVNVTRRLSKFIPNDFVKISESGISSLKDLKVALSHADAALIGTTFMKAKEIENIVRSFVEAKLC